MAIQLNPLNPVTLKRSYPRFGSQSMLPQTLKWDAQQAKWMPVAEKLPSKLSRWRVLSMVGAFLLVGAFGFERVRAQQVALIERKQQLQEEKAQKLAEAARDVVQEQKRQVQWHKDFLTRIEALPLPDSEAKQRLIEKTRARLTALDPHWEKAEEAPIPLPQHEANEPPVLQEDPQRDADGKRFMYPEERPL